MQYYNNAFLGNLIDVSVIKKHFSEMKKFDEKKFHDEKVKVLNNKIRMSKYFLKRLDCFDSFHENMDEFLKNNKVSKDVSKLKDSLAKKKKIRERIEKLVDYLKELKEKDEAGSLEAEKVLDDMEKTALMLADLFNKTTKLSVYFTTHLVQLIEDMTDDFLKEWKEGFELHDKKIPGNVDKNKIKRVSLSNKVEPYLSDIDYLLSSLPSIIHSEEYGTTADLKFVVHRKIERHYPPAA